VRLRRRWVRRASEKADHDDDHDHDHDHVGTGARRSFATCDG
jgi:hypothetical protein